MTYSEAEKLFSKCRNKAKGYRLAGRLGSTRLVKTTKGYGILLHKTVVVDISKDNVYTLNTGGWLTPTTKDRIQEYSPARITSSKGVWYLLRYDDGKLKPEGIGFDRWVKKTYPVFFDGIRIDIKGRVLNAKKTSKHSTNEVKAEQYAKAFADKVCAGNFPRPSGGDCWYCSMHTETGETLGDATDPSHIQNHIQENYFVPALLWNALKDAGYKPEYAWIGIVEMRPEKARIKRILKRYVLGRLNRGNTRQSSVVVGKPMLQMIRGAK